MRVISGKFRGKKLNSPKDDRVRPTTDRAKESLFNVIQDHIYESRFLDLFSGTGAISIEAYSRGAKDITLVENSKASLLVIKSNINLIKDDEIKKVIKTVQKDAIEFIKNDKAKYDVIFADPPYDFKSINLIPNLILEKSLLNPGGIIVLETDQKFKFDLDERLEIIKEKKYSISKFTIIREK